MKVIYRLHEIRTKQKLTVRELAKLSGLSKTTISDIENDKANPTVYIICELAVALNCSPYDLFYLEL